jgi:hypothetical protein
MPRCTRGLARPLLPASALEEDRDEELTQFWEQLPLAERRQLLRVDKRQLFQRIRETYCSRCFGLFQLRQVFPLLRAPSLLQPVSAQVWDAARHKAPRHASPQV